MNPCALLVHDNVAVRTLLGVRLEAAGFSAVVATDGIRGLEAAREHRPSLVLVDMTSPPSGAAELVHILAERRDRDMQICVIADPDDSRKLESLDGVRVLTRGQVFHPGFTTALRRRFADGIPYAEERREPFFLDV